MSELSTTARNTTAIRKAAILISTLDTKTADELLERMTAEQQAQVRQAVMELNEIRPLEEDRIIREFIRGGSEFAGESTEGVELDASLARKLRTPELYEVAAPPRTKAPPFHALCDASADAIARQLERQHPQVIAVVVAHLPPRRAAELVQRLGTKLQSDVLRRVAELDQADPEVIREIEEGLEQLLSGEIRAARNRHAGLSTVSAILNAAGSDRAGLLENLVAHDREFANMLGAPSASSSATEHSADLRTAPDRATMANQKEEVERTLPSKNDRTPDVTAFRMRIKQGSNQTSRESARHRLANSEVRSPSPVAEIRSQQTAAVIESSEVRPNRLPDLPVQAPVPFEELAQMTDHDWATLIQAIDPQILLLSLAGASEAFVARIMRQLQPRESQDLSRRLEQMGPIRLDDIDRAQRHVAQRAAELIAQGKLGLPRHRSFAAAA